MSRRHLMAAFSRASARQDPQTSTPPSLPSADGPSSGSSGAPDGGQTEGAADTATSEPATSATLGTTSGADTSTTGAMACVPGMSIACFCPTGFAGAQSCNPEGTGYSHGE